MGNSDFNWETIKRNLIREKENNKGNTNIYVLDDFIISGNRNVFLIIDKLNERTIVPWKNFQPPAKLAS